MRIAIYEPDIPQNLGALIRLGAALDVALDVIEPCSFPFGGKQSRNKQVRRAGMDYLELVDLDMHSSWTAFEAARATQGKRLILLTTSGAVDYRDVTYQESDILLSGSESSGVPDFVHHAADVRVCIPMKPPARSLNVVNATAMVLGEGLRQIRTNTATNSKPEGPAT
ncbi:MAG: tRNA (cytidine(34)-2'-O)-methyltransferase [Alphaproteobacteria bacterium]|jgi:tRNA (cytidine/uridine-2'-O-)-methyltransferase|nr:tRNA (cytidine(34)-2'-O)-methyltransferase [Alphaproteobacteria bacterium]MBT4083231.1 tRNA (cytidine(34)-2'-O)-methyltransferase [Alphaproteobacteria bacterium]MBT4544273.1 tRNA (cytidine(34)-2'-O)-methyltransferase [Alphaproteobacteria bacterium]MBT7743830.1 tRNA (cytidine(34)-2'-O)-methyltransferase [Alphaproteobacteria bacterium]